MSAESVRLKSKGRYRVLIADDSAFIRKLIRKILESTGEFEVIDEANNGSGAVVSYDENRPDLVILDVNMPIMDGLTAAKKILQKDPNAKIIIVSATGEQKLLAKQAGEIGVKAIISKPFNPSKIVDVAKKVVTKG